MFQSPLWHVAHLSMAFPPENSVCPRPSFRVFCYFSLSRRRNRDPFGVGTHWGPKLKGAEEKPWEKEHGHLSASVSKLFTARRVRAQRISLDVEHLPQKISVLGRFCAHNIPLRHCLPSHPPSPLLDFCAVPLCSWHLFLISCDSRASLLVCSDLPIPSWRGSCISALSGPLCGLDILPSW